MDGVAVEQYINCAGVSVLWLVPLVPADGDEQADTRNASEATVVASEIEARFILEG